MKRSDTRILTTHTGSLPRPGSLTELFTARASGAAVDEERLKAEGRSAVAAALAHQRECGIDVAGNGEQQRESFVLYLRHRLSGLAGEGDRTGVADVESYPEFQKARSALLSSRPAVSNFARLPKAVGPIAYTGHGALDDECETFAHALESEGAGFSETFMTAPSPGILAAIVRNEHYETTEAYVAAVADALRVEYERIVERGHLLQLDCPDLALERHVSFKAKPLSQFLEFVELVVAAINRALRNVPRDRVRLHVCWGNYEGPHDRDVPLNEILPILLRANVGGLVLPFANPRHAHEFKCLRTTPLAPDQILVAGVIDVLTNFVEHPEVVADRLIRIAEAVGDPSRVLAGTDCGFDTSAGMGRVAPDVAWAKFKSLRDGARLASEAMF
ncbi:MAG: cobalamin-independent methionine synthase II family protein [Alphaproteobacteria bacterium]|nr:cobalamin-independent methionine synthase II family protein [Alphaproteobacteria bacterium]